MASFLSRLFGGTSAPATPTAAQATLHKEFRIFPDPIPDGSAFRIAARIEKTFGDDTKTHQLIRADTRATRDEAVEASIAKAKQAIDQLGDTLFG
ncbi:MAG: HlyU family transcriptional regulator [Paracoccaceae bacterium]